MSSDKFIKSGDKWITQEGKEVILMEPDVPWYINLGVRKPIGLIKPKYTELNRVDYRANADFTSDFVLDPTRPDMGYGYSLSDRKGEPCLCKADCNKVEGFDGMENHTISQNASKVLLSLFIVALVFHAFGSK